jgi:hypothetical protein
MRAIPAGAGITAATTNAPQVYSVAHWQRAREIRARSGRAPRLAVQRVILLREVEGGRWAAAVHQFRFGRWSGPEWICPAASLADARAAALAEWSMCGIPVVWAYRDDGSMRPFYAGLNEPSEARS